jgi:hypothetical protein
MAAWERRKMQIKFWFQNPKGRDHPEHLGIDGWIILEWILDKEGGKVWSGFIWRGIGNSDRFL